MKKLQVLFFIALVASLPVAAQVRFGGLDLNDANQLLFTAEVDAPEYGTYSALFQSDISGGTLTQLSFFPERISRIGGGLALQIQNRFGVFRSDDQGTNFAPVEQFPSFVSGDEVRSGKVYPIQGSPDGRFLTYVQATSPAYGELRIFDVSAGTETVVSEKVEITLDEPSLKWSPDSEFFVYAKEGGLYYYSVEHYDDDRVLDEGLRRIGNGQISSVIWSSDGNLYYITGSLVYRILPVEFFTRSLYQDLLKIGTIVGKLPYIYDPNFDRFWISPDGAKILISREGRNLNLFYLRTNDYASTGETISLPYLYLPRNTRLKTVLWSQTDKITVLTGSIVHGETDTAVYRLDLADPDTASAFEVTEDEGVRGLYLSPAGTTALVLYEEKLELRDYAEWTVTRTMDHPDPIHGLWLDSERFVVAGRHIIEQHSTETEDSTLLALAQVESYGYGPEANSIQAQSGSYALERTNGDWSEIEEVELRDASVAGGEYRVYLENLSSGWYQNTIMVRNIDSVGTSPLFPRPQKQYEPFPSQDEPVDLANFTHGSRIRRREVSLVFNAIDSVAGLTEILNTLAQYEVTATFFLNGEFIRRHPGAVLEIAESGHEVGSLFYAYFDMSNARFRVTSDFIKQGLARNEDEYFEATGKELSLLWHAPYYFVSPEIIAASRSMNYAYVGRDVDSLDWVPKRDENGISRLYFSSADIVERIIESKQPGSIIAMTVGRPGDDRPDGGRDDYLFQRLDVLMNSLIERGYQMVPVSTLMDHAQ